MGGPSTGGVHEESIPARLDQNSRVARSLCRLVALCSTTIRNGIWARTSVTGESARLGKNRSSAFLAAGFSTTAIRGVSGVIGTIVHPRGSVQ